MQQAFLGFPFLFFLLFVFPQTSALGQDVGFSPPGRMIDAGGFRLHLLVEGEEKKGKRPTVIFFHGAGDVALHWSLVLPKIGQITTAVAIDQNGEAWSEHGHNKSLKQQVYDSKQALVNGGYPPPYVVVGHSLGGTMALLFSEAFREDVMGVVLVDGTHPDVVLKVFDKEKKKAFWKRFRLTADDDIPSVIKEPLIEKPTVSSVQVKRDFGDMLSGFSRQDRALIEWLYNTKPLTYVKGKGNDYSAEIFEEMFQNQDQYHLGEIPLLVISGGDKQIPKGDEYWTSEALKQHRDFLQQDLLKFSSNSRHIIAKKSGHHIHIDEPKIVVRAIKNLLKNK